MEKFKPEKKEPLSKAFWLRLHPDVKAEVDRVSKNLGMGKSEFINQAVKFALENIQ